MDKLLPNIVGMIVQMSSSVAIESAVKLATPSSVGAVKGFLIKGASTLLSAALGGSVASFASKNAEDFVEIVKKSPAELESPKTED